MTDRTRTLILASNVLLVVGAVVALVGLLAGADAVTVTGLVVVGVAVVLSVLNSVVRGVRRRRLAKADKTSRAVVEEAPDGVSRALAASKAARAKAKKSKAEKERTS